jgi:hypothetical protein
MSTQGSCPERVVYIHNGNKISLNEEWDDINRQYIYHGERLQPAFCSDAYNEKTIKTGEDWAKRYKNQKKLCIQN